MRESMPPRIAAIDRYATAYWGEVINGTGEQYYVYPEGDKTVNVFDYKQCVEVRRPSASGGREGTGSTAFGRCR